MYKKDGGAGYRSPCPSHAKRVLYHLSYTPIHRKRKTSGVVSASFKVSVFLSLLYKKNKNSPTGIRTPVFHVTGEDTNQLYYWRLLIYSMEGEAKAAVGCIVR